MSINYFDTASTSKVDPRVREAMLPYLDELYGNSSSSHEFGRKTKEAIENARNQVADLINCNSDEIIFTSGSTESINLALKGFVESNWNRGNHIITVKTEHKAVLSTCEYLETKGIEVTYLDVNNYGLINADELLKAIRPDTFLISVMFANNETGVIQPIEEIGAIAKENNIAFFCDATQAAGKIEINVFKANIDMLSLSCHKLNGPKGVGALFKKKEINLTPLLHGGGQESGLRGGTYNTPGIIGFGKACEIASNAIASNGKTVENLRLLLMAELEKIDDTVIAGDSARMLPNIINAMIPGLSSAVFISKISGFALSNGSACTSEIIESSHVLKAMGYTDELCASSVRISLDSSITKDQIMKLIAIIKTELNFNTDVTRHILGGR